MSSTKKCICCTRIHSSFDPKTVTWNFASGDMICDSCIDILGKEVAKYKNEDTAKNLPSFNAQEVLDLLNRYVVSQDEAKKAVAVAVSQHLIKISSGITYKSNLLIFGPSGSGKTEIARALKELKLPLIEFNCSTLSPTGYIGDSPTNMIEQLYYSSGCDVGLTENGIIFLDEFDKLAHGNGEKNEFKHKSIQQEFLKLIEGTEVTIKIDGGMKQIKIDTTKILFIAAGAFTGLETQFGLNKKDNVIGISSMSQTTAISAQAGDSDKWQSKVSADHLIQFGLMPELVGRFPIISFVEKLHARDFYNILTTTESSAILQIKKMAEAIGIKLYFSDELINSWSEKASKLPTGARGVRGEIEKCTRNIFLHDADYRNSSVYLSLGNSGDVLVTKKERPTLKLVEAS